MIAVWPAELPQRANRDGFGYNFGEGRAFTRPESGPPRVRRRFSSAAKSVTAGITLNWSQLLRLERFWDEDTAGGSLPFWFPDQLRDGIAITTSDGRELYSTDGSALVTAAWWLVLFGEEPPKPVPIGGEYWSASMQLWVMP